MNGARHRAPRILLAGGGSGGSATPVLAVAQELRESQPDARFLYVGTRSGPERDLVLAAEIPYAAVSSGKLRRYWDPQNFVDPFKIARGVLEAYVIARRFQPHVAFAAGGFASVPPIIAARLGGANVLIHQQDVEPGLANRLLAPFARRITVTLPTSLAHFPGGRTSVTGNPVRREMLWADASRGFRSLGLDPSVPLVVATGGGTGALGLNRLVAAAAPRLVERCQLVHLTGRGRAVPRLTDSKRYRPVEFLVDEIPDLLAAASLVVTRAGLGTLTELAALARAALLIPMPGSHQWANARAFERLGAVEVADQDTLTADALADRVMALLDDEVRRTALGEALAGCMPRDAASRIANELLALVPRR